MKQTVNFTAFVDAFHSYDRYNQFGYIALRALFDYMEELEEETGEEFELDVIALCCDWTRYDSAVDACSEYAASGVDTGLDAEEAEEQCLEWLRDNTQVIETGSGNEILVMAF